MKHFYKNNLFRKENFMETKHETKFRLFGRIVLFTAFLGISLIFSSCFVDYGLNTENYDVVFTGYDSTYRFGTAKYYSLPDSIVQIGNGGSITRAFDDLIIQEVTSNFASMGWTRVYDNTADVIVTLSVTTSTYVIDSYDWWYYWSWYPGWSYYPGYGSGWGYYYPYPPSEYSFSTASLIINMADPSKGNQSNKTLPVEWLAIMNGVMNGSNQQARLSGGIDQAFIQSPYLKVK